MTLQDIINKYCEMDRAGRDRVKLQMVITDLIIIQRDYIRRPSIAISIPKEVK